MKLKKLILAIFLILLIPVVYASVSVTLNSPADHLETSETTVSFNWSSTGNSVVIPSYLFITESLNTSNFQQNQSIKHCTNSTATNCSALVSGLQEGFYNWYILSGDNATQANVTGTGLPPFNTTRLNHLNFTFSNNGTVNRCDTILSSYQRANSTQIVGDLNVACPNVTFSSASNLSVIQLLGPDWGSDAYFNMESGNASELFGFAVANATDNRTVGTQDNTSSSARWLEIYKTSLAGNHTYFQWWNLSGFVAMFLNKDTGDLNVTGTVNAGGLGLSGNLEVQNITGVNLISSDTGNITLSPAGGEVSIDNTLAVGTGTQWLNIYMLASEGIFNSTVPFKFTQDTTIQGNLNVTGNITGLDVFVKTDCESYSQVVQAITNVSAYQLIDFETNVECNEISTDGQNFTLEQAGEYKVSVDLHADKTGGSTTTVESILFLDGSQVNGSARQRTVNSNNEIGFFAINWDIITVSANQVLSVGLTGSTDAAQLDMDCILCQRNVTAAISIDRLG